jgi:hypothetical protein
VKKLTEDQVAVASDLVATNTTSIRKHAAELGVDESTLRRAIRRYESRGGRSGSELRELSGEGAVEVPVIVRDYSQHESIRVYPMGDFHIGSPAHHRAKLDEWLDYIVDTPNATILNTGDNLNAAILGSKSDVYAEVQPAQAALEDFEDRFRPVAEAGRLDVVTGGNHEARIYRATGIDVMRVAARTLGVQHFEGAAVMVYKVGGQTYTFWVRHGTGNAPSSMNALTKAGDVAIADVYVTGHTHRQAVVLEDQFSVVGGKVVRSPRRYVSSGSFVSYERYAAERGYVPSHLGAPRIFLDGTRKDFHVSI